MKTTLITAYMMTLSFVIMLIGAITNHNWIAVFFAFTGAWFAWEAHFASIKNS